MIFSTPLFADYLTIWDLLNMFDDCYAFESVHYHKFIMNKKVGIIYNIDL